MKEVNLSMIEPKLGLFQVQDERVRVHATAYGEPRLVISPDPLIPLICLPARKNSPIPYSTHIRFA